MRLHRLSSVLALLSLLLGGLLVQAPPAHAQEACFAETLEDGKVYRVQYFERARFEHHPENPAPYDVLLGQFGRRLLAAGTP